MFISSRPLLCGGGSAFGCDQLGPDQVPVVRAEFPAANSAISGQFDCRAMLNRNNAARFPVGDCLLADANRRADGGTNGCVIKSMFNFHATNSTLFV